MCLLRRGRSGRQQKDVDDKSSVCWNGTTKGDYGHAIVEDGFESQAYNPEVRLDPSEQGPFSDLVLRIRDVTAQVMRAERGETVQWWRDAKEELEEVRIIQKCTRID